MKKTVLFAAAIFTIAAASASSGQPPGEGKMQTYDHKCALIDDRVAAAAESPQLAWTEQVTMQLPLKKIASSSLDLRTDPDVGWAPGDTKKVNSYCNVNYGRDLTLVEHPDVGIAWNVQSSDHFYKDVQIKTGQNFSEQWPGAEMSFNDHQYQRCTVNIISSSPAEHSKYMRARMQYAIAAVPWRM